MIKLRDYQKECVDTLNSVESGSHLISLATGLGKTVIFSSLQRQGRTLILSHRDELVRQPEKYYDCSYGIEKADQSSNGEEVVSASVQSLSTDKRLNRFAPDTFDTIIVDEAHHAAAPTYKKILQHFSGARRVFGFTATPKRGDEVRLDDVFDDIIFEHDLRWGIQNGYLCNVRCKLVNGNYSLSGIKKTAGDFNMSDMDKTMNNQETIALIAKVYMDNCHTAGRHTLLYCINKKACLLVMTAIRSLVPDEPETIQMVTGDTPEDERHQVLEDFASGKVKCIVNCMVLTEGTDLPICDAILNARPTCNSSLYTQIVGRGTRLSEGKEFCLVIDIIPDNGERRTLCTAPTLFGVDPMFLDKKYQEKINEQEDLLSLCDIIRGNIGSIIEKMEYQIENVNRMVDEAEFALNNSENISEFLKNAPWKNENSFDDLFVREGSADEEKAYAIYPTYDQRIYLSKPDVLGNTTIRFYLSGNQCYIGELPWDEALDLAKKYCLTMPNYSRACWDKKAAESWKNLPCTENQANRIVSDLQKYNLNTDNANSLSKLDASMLIDHVCMIRDNKKFLKNYSCSPNASAEVKKRRKDAFELREKETQKMEKAGRHLFGAFRATVCKEYEKAQKARELEEQKLQEARELKFFKVNVDIYGSYTPKPSARQQGYLEALVREAAMRGYLLPEGLPSLDAVQASLLISIFKEILHKLPKVDTPKTIANLEEILENVKKTGYGRFTVIIVFT